MPPDNRSSRQSSDLEEQASSERSPHEPWTSTLDDLRAAAFTLTPVEQMSLAQDLMENARPPDPAWEAELARESEHYFGEVDGACEESVPGEHVLAELRARHLRAALSVLLCEKEGIHHAYAVELGLAAMGNTVGAALVELSRVVLDHYAEAEAERDPSRLSFDAWPDIVCRHARARKRSLRREGPEGDRITSIEMPSEKDIVKRAASRRGAREVG